MSNSRHHFEERKNVTTLKMNEYIQTPIKTQETEFFHLIKVLIYSNFDEHNFNKIQKFLLRRRSPRNKSFDINASNPHSHTALSLCLHNITETTERGPNHFKTAVVNLLINSGADVHIRIASVCGCMNSMLHIACDKNNPLNIVQLLLDKGLTANDINKHNQTPLHFASRCINVEMMSLLINNGADPNACDIDGDTPLTFLMNTFENLFNVNCVTKLGKIEICLNLLLQNGANINQIGKSGQSSLFLVINGLSSMSVGTEIKLKFIKKLIDAGADINIGYIKKEVMLQKQQMYQFEGEEDFNDILYVNGDTPLHAAVHMGSLDVVIFLLEYNPDINHANCCKETAFDYATRHKYFCIRDEILFYIRKNIFQYFYDK